MNKKGFTLLELLAVIVILAIIAVITVPKIAGMIETSKQGGAMDSFYGALRSAELGYTKQLQSKKDLKGETCDISTHVGNKVTCTNGTVASFSGKVPSSGVISLDDSGSATGANLMINGYKCSGTVNTQNPCIKAN